MFSTSLLLFFHHQLSQLRQIFHCNVTTKYFWVVWLLSECKKIKGHPEECLKSGNFITNSSLQKEAQYGQKEEAINNEEKKTELGFCFFAVDEFRPRNILLDIGTGELLLRRRSKVLWEGLNVKWHPLVGSVSISDWPFKAAEAAVLLSNWLRTLQLPQLTGGCSLIWNKIRFGLVLDKFAPPLHRTEIGLWELNPGLLFPFWTFRSHRCS